ncbi:MAG: asparagine synthase (glutamine-hydrolyzing) [Deltaproteobacteria bacterium]|nr:asparagine synthase (glutamine-hydrolyzing) [Deltaproteobacteria bacterium]
MCGIVGFIANTNFDRLRNSLSEAVSKLVHRGPNDSGLFFDENHGLGLGHRRLSVIDLSDAGRQPMASQDGRFQIVYNGEVYNFKEIRKTLEDLGHVFRTDTDTEVILGAYRQWGIDCLERFTGMFSLGLWDETKECLFLARDRLGIKPLFYYHAPGSLFFASELKALMALSPFPGDLDHNAIPLFLHYQYIPAPRTVFKNTFKLLPGHFARFRKGSLEVKPYWTLPEHSANVPIPPKREEDALEELDRLLTMAVSDRLISDVPLGGLLSGGIDSSIVVALMQKVSNAPVKTFSIGFNEPGYNEAPWAAKVAEHLKTDHTAFYVTPKEALAVIPHLPEIYDEPFADASAVPTFLVSKLARSRVTVALSGDGGDEQFAGYVRYWSTRAMAAALQRMPERLREPLGSALARIPVSWVERSYMPWRRFLPQRFNVANFPDKWEKLVDLMRGGDIQSLYRMTVHVWPKEMLPGLLQRRLVESQYEETFRETEGWPVLSQLMRVDQKTYLPDAMLTKVDRASMAVSLEVRVPLLDHRVVEFTSCLPDHLKYRNGKGKYLLRKLLSRYVPEALFERPKMGFGVPIEKWFRSELKEMLSDYLSVSRLKREGLFDSGCVETQLKEHLSGRANHCYRLWALLMWEMWRERWMES